MLAGVAGGLAEMWDADPSLVRLVWALLVIFTGGIALLVYIVMAIVVPEEDDEYVQPAPPAGAASHAPPEVDAGSPSTAMPDGSASPGLAATSPAAATPPPTYWLPGSGPSRADARAARRAARRERRRGDSSAPLVIGVFLVLLGGFFLAREWLPELDWDWFWPVMLIALGALLLVLALGRRPSDSGDPS
jgi:phage shock protein PspC (stress-responsive transcriptional regulator)